jgi:prepilin-type N-terminal cleavage/methylation domain-containing protein/prepilin-type processing-associated H-X9-DG protein
MRCHHNHRQPTTTAFTLVELLVVITIIGILIALPLPAVQAAREAARRMQCSNNQKQIGLGLHMHLAAKVAFPDGWSWFSDTSENTGGNEATWITRLLPYVEQAGLDALINWKDPFGQAAAGKQAEVNRTSIPLFLCPSNDPVENICGGLYARGTYAANNGIGALHENTFADLPISRTLGSVKDRSLAGTFFMNSRLAPADVSDGLSNTAFVSEIRAVPGEDMRGMLHYPEGPFYHHNNTPNSAALDEMRMDYCVSVTGAACEGVYPWWPNRLLTMSARSCHPGGVNLLLGDGSVTFVGDNIALNIWQAICTPRSISNEINFAGF